MERQTVFIDWMIQHNKMTFLPKFISQFNIIPIEVPGGIFVDTHKLIPECIHKSKGAIIEQKKHLKMKNTVREIPLPGFTTYYVATVIKVVVLV